MKRETIKQEITTYLKGILCKANVREQSFFLTNFCEKSLTLEFKFVDFVYPGNLQNVSKKKSRSPAFAQL